MDWPQARPHGLLILDKTDRRCCASGQTCTAADCCKAHERRQGGNEEKEIEHTGGWLTQVVRGYLNYHAVPGNLRRLYTFRRPTARHWLFMPRRRSERSRWTRERFETLIDRFLPEPKILHPCPRPFLAFVGVFQIRVAVQTLFVETKQAARFLISQPALTHSSFDASA
jgi:hypothetical protein